MWFVVFAAAAAVPGTSWTAIQKFELLSHWGGCHPPDPPISRPGGLPIWYPGGLGQPSKSLNFFLAVQEVPGYQSTVGFSHHPDTHTLAVILCLYHAHCEHDLQKRLVKRQLEITCFSRMHLLIKHGSHDQALLGQPEKSSIFFSLGGLRPPRPHPTPPPHPTPAAAQGPGPGP